MSLELTIDLDDGLGSITVARAPKGASSPTRQAPPTISITSTPVALALLSVQVHCESCLSTHQSHRGLFLESRLSNGVRAFRAISMRDAAPYHNLPRHLTYGQAEVVPICADCLMIERIFQDAVARAQVQSELQFDGPGPVQAGPLDPPELQHAVADLAKLLHELHEEGLK